VIDAAALQIVLSVLTGWLDRREAFVQATRGIGLEDTQGDALPAAALLKIRVATRGRSTRLDGSDRVDS
jgi:hypothetical protein